MEKAPDDLDSSVKFSIDATTETEPGSYAIRVTGASDPPL